MRRYKSYKQITLIKSIILFSMRKKAIFHVLVYFIR